jgi:hypothetical protein
LGISISYLPIKTWLDIEREGITMDSIIREFYSKNQPLYASVSIALEGANTENSEKLFREAQQSIELLVVAIKLSIDAEFVDPRLVAYYFNSSYEYLREVGPYRQYFYHKSLANNYQISHSDCLSIENNYLLLKKIVTFKNFNSHFLMQSVLRFTFSPAENEPLLILMSCFEILETMFGRTYKLKQGLSFAERVARVYPEQQERSEVKDWFVTQILPIRDKVMHGGIDGNKIDESLVTLTQVTLFVIRCFFQFLDNFSEKDDKSAKLMYKLFNESLNL